MQTRLNMYRKMFQDYVFFFQVQREVSDLETFFTREKGANRVFHSLKHLNFATNKENYDFLRRIMICKEI
jgi:hypothetical protein